MNKPKGSCRSDSAGVWCSGFHTQEEVRGKWVENQIWARHLKMSTIGTGNTRAPGADKRWSLTKRKERGYLLDFFPF